VGVTTSITIIKDHVTTRATTLMYTQAQKDGVLKYWHDTDPLLLSLQHQPTFQGKVRLYDLEPFHFRVLLALNLSLVGDLTDEQTLDSGNLTMRALDWTAMGLINCLETRAQAGISTLMINRVSAENVLVDVTMSMEPIKMPKPRMKTAAPVPNKLRVIVDNERE
jgi:hypothetical protein